MLKKIVLKFRMAAALISKGPDYSDFLQETFIAYIWATTKSSISVMAFQFIHYQHRRFFPGRQPIFCNAIFSKPSPDAPTTTS